MNFAKYNPGLEGLEEKSLRCVAIENAAEGSGRTASRPQYEEAEARSEVRGLLSPPGKGSWASHLTFLSAVSAQLITSCAPLSALPKPFLRSRQTFPPGRSARIAVLCFMQTSPQGGSRHFPCWADRLRSPQGLTAGQCQTKLPEPDRGADLYLDVPPLSEEHSLPLFLIFI